MSQYQIEVRSPYPLLSTTSDKEGKWNSLVISVLEEETIFHLKEKIKLNLTQEYNPNSIRLIYLGRVLNNEEIFKNIFEKLTNQDTISIFHLVVGYKVTKPTTSSNNPTASSSSRANPTPSRPIVTQPQVLPEQSSTESTTQAPNLTHQNPTEYLYFNVVRHQNKHYLSPIRSHLSSIDGVQGIPTSNPITNTTSTQTQQNENPTLFQRVRERLNQFGNGEGLFMGVWMLIQSYFLASIVVSALDLEDSPLSNVVVVLILGLLIGFRTNAFDQYWNSCVNYVQTYLPDLSQAPTSTLGTVFRFIYLFFSSLIPERPTGGNNMNGFD